ncbi:MAG: S1 RNA-binding domain-containing protein [Candidatus Woesearchaeota archaeon]|nr:MAG: S1 RNA-binding domain-containing protein [Candidatus Woesearchaeota archaeon]
MLLQRKGFPQEGEYVFCVVKTITYNSVFVTLEDYKRDALIHISEVSPGRIRNIRDYVKIGKMLVCKVLRVNESNGHIDVSLRRVSDAERRRRSEDRKNEQRAEKLLEVIAHDLKMDVNALYAQIAPKVLEEYDYLHYFFEDIVENDVNPEDIGLSKNVSSVLKAVVVDRIKPKSIVLEGLVKIKSDASDGLLQIKKALSAFQAASEGVSVSYKRAGEFRFSIVAPDFEIAEEAKKVATAALTKNFSGEVTVVSS